jgi:hypothetical protein
VGGGLTLCLVGLLSLLVRHLCLSGAFVNLLTDTRHVQHSFFHTCSYNRRLDQPVVAPLEGQKRDTYHCACERVDLGRRVVQHRESFAGEFEGTAFVEHTIPILIVISSNPLYHAGDIMPLSVSAYYSLTTFAGLLSARAMYNGLLKLSPLRDKVAAYSLISHPLCLLPCSNTFALSFCCFILVRSSRMYASSVASLLASWTTSMQHILVTN